MQTYLDVLRQIPSDEEAAAIRTVANTIDALQSELSALPPHKVLVGLESLAPLRLNSSGTLRRGFTEPWIKANRFAAERISTGAMPTWSDALHINAMLTGRTTDACLRTEAVYVGPCSGSQINDLAEHLRVFVDEVLPARSGFHPLEHAAQVQYWLVSLHPFADGNGRTAVMLADWIANVHGYLPQTFATQIDGIVGYMSGRSTSVTVARATLKVMGNVLRSTKILAQASQHSS